MLKDTEPSLGPEIQIQYLIVIWNIKTLVISFDIA